MNDKLIIYGVSYSCPVLVRKDNCPLKRIDSLSFKEKVILIDGLCVEEKNEILQHHKACSKSREYR
jgi:hypothetical protein